jgi:hypothetical protein
VESRRKLYSRLYTMDKSVAVIFDRPPRLSSRHSDCKWPADLSDDIWLKSPVEVHEAQAMLSQEGWSLDGKLCSATWIRARHLCAEMLEDILEYKFLPMTPDVEANLR